MKREYALTRLLTKSFFFCFKLMKAVIGKVIGHIPKEKLSLKAILREDQR